MSARSAEQPEETALMIDSDVQAAALHFALGEEAVPSAESRSRIRALLAALGRRWAARSGGSASWWGKAADVQAATFAQWQRYVLYTERTRREYQATHGEDP